MAFESLSDKLSAAFKKLRGKGRLTAADVKEAMKEVRMALLEADVSYKVVKEFTKSVTERASGADVLEALSPAQQVIKIVNEELVKLMGSEASAQSRRALLCSSAFRAPVKRQMAQSLQPICASRASVRCWPRAISIARLP